ncbi:uncharacterized protein LOC129728972 [Wyeomyia smithii]|uniref:uncharacterized protein LOC129728972 n=1 Tax=Wyeomyia smithii TaxID=174621 RepID=UPI002467B369|nr:uncharacterized protein LOC129728972 [Wyeomyia smithii]
MGAPYHPSTNGQVERYVQTFKQKLKALKCPTSQFNLEIGNILLTYRKMLHPSTGQSPSMLMFGRQIRSRIDLMLPKNEIKHASDLTVKDFMTEIEIVEKAGKLRYTVRLDDGRLWERHVDHIAGVGAHLPEDSVNTPREVVDTERAFLTVPATSPVASAPEPTGQVSVGQHPVTPSQPSESLTDIVPGLIAGPSTPTAIKPSDEPLRRSKRSIKVPQRLNL